MFGDFDPSVESIMKDAGGLCPDALQLLVEKQSSENITQLGEGTIPGILILENNKTYGRTENKRLLYKCIPNNKRLPAFLVPYDIKLGFSKNIKNKYVVLKFDFWTTDSPPRGLLSEVIGDITNLEAFYEYKLYCRNIKTTPINKEVSKKIRKITQQDHAPGDIENHTDRFVFTIDSKNSQDFDDGFSIMDKSDESNPNTIITIYIANVSLQLETLKLWDVFCDRVSTIYLPDRKIPMFPTRLSNIFSLIENTTKIAFCLDIVISPSNMILNTRFYNSIIKVRKNFVYEEPTLLKNTHYKKLFHIAKLLNPKITDSHDLVSHFMIFTNTQCAMELYCKQTGIYRSLTIQPTTATQIIDSDTTMKKETKQFMQNWISKHGQYVLYSSDYIEHSPYIHITSPIRRLVDLLNQMMFLKSTTTISEEAQQFLDKCLQQIDIINEKMKSIAKVERECEIMRKCITNPVILENIYDAYIICRRELVTEALGIIKYKYTLYIENEKIILTMKSEEPRELFKKYQVKLYKIESYGIASKIKIRFVN